MNLQSQAESVADNAAEKTGIAIETLLPVILTLLPVLLQQLQGCLNGNETASEFVRDHFDSQTGTFDKHLIDRMRPQARRAARRNGKAGLSRFELDAISESALQRAMEEHEEGLRVCMVEASANQE